jgi:peptide/nickel transport system substrate-binding protein
MEAPMRSMSNVRRGLALALLIVLAACQATPSARPSAGNPANANPGQSSGGKRLTAVIMGNPPTFSSRFNPTTGSVPGLDVSEELLNAGMSNYTVTGDLRPQMAEAVPSLENGLWKLLPDGRMETTWKIRQGAVWHDGKSLTSDDLLFTTELGNDRSLPASFVNPINAFVERVEAPDPSTITVYWASAVIGADTLFTKERGLPLPKHLLERPYTENKDTFVENPYWNREFVGLGPFKLREMQEGSYIIMDANDSYLLGRPKIDTIEIKMVPDATVLITTALAGTAELSLGARMSIDQALQARDNWRDGTVIFAPGGSLNTWPQFINPNPPVITDLRFRKALQYSVDRQNLADSVLYGMAQVADTSVSPVEPDYKDIESAIVRYPYDPQRAAQLMEELGYVKGPDGYRDASGQKLQFEARATAQLDTQVKALSVVADYWRQFGITVDELIVPNQRTGDREYRHSRPAFETLAAGNPPENFQVMHSKYVPTQDNAFIGGNRSRYSNSELDRYIDSYFITIQRPARMEILRNVVRIMGEQLPFMPLTYTTQHVLIGNKIQNVNGRGSYSTEGWNAEQWDIAR